MRPVSHTGASITQSETGPNSENLLQNEACYQDFSIYDERLLRF